MSRTWHGAEAGSGGEPASGGMARRSGRPPRRQPGPPLLSRSRRRSSGSASTPDRSSLLHRPAPGGSRQTGEGEVVAAPVGPVFLIPGATQPAPDRLRDRDRHGRGDDIREQAGRVAQARQAGIESTSRPRNWSIDRSSAPRSKGRNWRSTRPRRAVTTPRPSARHPRGRPCRPLHQGNPPSPGSGCRPSTDRCRDDRRPGAPGLATVPMADTADGPPGVATATA